jgi:hypothetical protein
MNKHKYFLVLAVILLITLIGSAAGCAPTSSTKQPAQPTITSFAASPAAINQGQQTTLSWNVSGATEISIQPEIGTVGASGSLMLSPNATVTYTLTATNQTGSTTSSAAVTVTPGVAGNPDLVITDMWFTGTEVYYTIKNQGNADSKPTWSHLYVNGFKVDDNYEQVLPAGQQRTAPFSAYQYTQQIGVSTEGYEFPPNNVKLCVDEENAVAESNEGNNCLNQTWGNAFTYDFKYNASLAKWRSSTGDLKWGGISADPDGAAYIYLRDLTICVPQQNNGWILGRFADFYGDPETHQALSREIVVPVNAKFTAQLGFKQGATSTNGVKVALGYLNDQFGMVLFPKMDVFSDGKLHPYEVDLSSLEGKKTEFFLWVEANGSPQGDCVKWVDPKITQE